MLAWFCFVAISNAVPTPAQAILQSLDEPSRRLVAQSPDPSEQSPDPIEQEAFERDMEQSEAPRKRTRRARRGGLPDGIAAPTVAGHGKAHYLGWGIADWSIAGALWVVGTYAAVYAIGFFGVAAIDGTLTSDERRGFRGLGVAAGAGSAALGGLGAMLAVKAGKNLNIWRELRAQERALTASRIDSGMR